jgi:hypothetical protein
MKPVKIVYHNGKQYFLQKSRTTGRFSFRETLLSDHDLVSMPNNKTIEIGKTGMPYLKPIR